MKESAIFLKKVLDKCGDPMYTLEAVRGTQVTAACGLVAQLDRVFDYESKGRRFESCRAHSQKALNHHGSRLFSCSRKRQK